MYINFNDKQAEIIEALLTSYIEDSRHTEEPEGSVNAAVNARQKVVNARAGKCDDCEWVEHEDAKLPFHRFLHHSA